MMETSCLSVTDVSSNSVLGWRASKDSAWWSAKEKVEKITSDSERIIVFIFNFHFQLRAKAERCNASVINNNKIDVWRF